MKWICMALVTVLLGQVVYVPCAAQSEVRGDEIDRTKLGIGKYVEVTYTSEKGEVKIAKGYIRDS